MASVAVRDNRWELYKVLSEPQRLRLLALSAQEELAVGELAELVGDSQPNVSRHLAPLRKLGLLSERKQGTRVFVRLGDDMRDDPVVADALSAGRGLCEEEGALGRIAALVARRDEAAREFFGRPGDLPDLADLGDAGDQAAFPAELPAYLSAIAPLLGRRGRAIDVGTGDGRLLEVLAPLFEHVVAVDREPAQLARTEQRLARRGYPNVTLLAADLQQDDALDAVLSHGHADAVFASRILHHAPRPLEAIRRLTKLLVEGGTLVVLDYAPHQDEGMREKQADLWLGFSGDDLLGYARDAGLQQARIVPIPAAFCGGGPDGHLSWHMLVAHRRRDDAAVKRLKTEKKHG